jgi:peroxiredoxin
MTVRRVLLAAAILFMAVGLPARATGETLKVGDKAPDFTLTDTNWKKVSLSDYLGKKNVVLAFYVLAFTGG